MTGCYVTSQSHPGAKRRCSKRPMPFWPSSSSIKPLPFTSRNCNTSCPTPAKEQVAETYLQFANRYYDPPRKANGETPAPDYAKAKALFQKALDIGLTPRKTEEVLLRIALSDFKASQWSEALKTLRQIETQFPKGALADQVKYYTGLTSNTLKRVARRIRSIYLLMI